MDHYNLTDSVTISVQKEYYAVDGPFFKLDFLTSPSDSTLKDDFTIYWEGCHVEGEGRNCTRACQDPALAFRDMTTVQNCLNYPYISYALEYPNLNLYDPDDVFGSFGFLDPSSVDLTKIRDVMFNCFKEASKDPTGCDEWYGTSAAENVFSNCKKSMCSSADKLVDNDLGGIGSFVSYYFQFVVLLIAWILLRVFQSWSQIPCFCWYFIRTGSRNAWKRAHSYQASAGRSSHHAVLLTSMVELQKAQCYFMIAIQIAALLTMRDLSYFQLQSYAHLIHNLVLMHFVAGTAIISVVFGLFILHLSNMRSSFIYCLTALTFTVSSVTRHYKNIFEISPRAVNGPQERPSNCGGHPGPAIYCTFSFDLLISVPEARYLWSDIENHAMTMYLPPGDHLFNFSLSVLIILFFNQFPLIRSVRYGQERQAKWFTLFEWLKLRFLNMARTKTLDAIKMSDFTSRKKLVNLFKFISTIVAEFFFIYLLCKHFSELITLSKIFNSAGMEWNIGQIVAVTVLLPPVVEYVYLASRGIIKGSQYRLPIEYRVTKDEKEAKVEVSVEEQSPYAPL